MGGPGDYISKAHFIPSVYVISLGFGAQLVSAVRSEVIRSWASSCNRGAFLVSALLKVRGHVGKTVAEILAPLLPTLRESSLKGHQAILSELDQLNKDSS